MNDLMIELDPRDDGDDLEFDCCRCTVCKDVVGPWLDDDDESTTRGARWTDAYMDAGLRLYCEGCAADITDMSAHEWLDTWEPRHWLEASALYWNARGPAVRIDRAVPGVDYDIGCCDICGRADMHEHTADEIGEYYPDPDYPRGPV